MSQLDTAPIFPLHPDGWPKARGYTNGFRVQSGCDLICVAGQIGWDTDGKFPGDGDVVAQFSQALDNFLAVVAAGGGKPTDVVSMTIYVTDMDQYIRGRSELGRIWQQRFGRHYPAMALVGVSALVEKLALVEIQGLAAISASDVTAESHNGCER
ncbi:MAG: RidA family protein [Myxococcales bacterium]|nr:RidA family protein [Myxococcales bacterium]